MLGQPVDSGAAELDLDALGPQPPPGVVQQQFGDLRKLAAVELAEHHDLIDPVEELRPEGLPQPVQFVQPDPHLLRQVVDAVIAGCRGIGTVLSHGNQGYGSAPVTG